LFGLASSSYSQTYLPHEKQTIDSLKQLLGKANTPERKDTLHDHLDKTYEKVALRHRYDGNLELGEKVIKEAMQVALDGKHYRVYGTLHVNLGQLYREMGLFEQSIEILGVALRIQDSVQNQKTIGTIYNNLGAAYFDNKEFDKAFEYFEKGAELRLKGGDPYVGDAYWNIAFLHKEVNDTANFHRFLIKASTHYERMEEQDYGKGSYFFCIATLHLSRNQFLKAKEAYKQVVPYYQKLGYSDFVAWAYHGISRSYTGLGDHRLALAYADSSYKLSHQIGHLERIRQSALIMSNVLVNLGDYKRALEMYKEHVVMTDSIKNTSNERALIKSEIKYRYDKQAAADSVKNAEHQRVQNALLAEEKAISAQKDTEIENRRLQQAILFGGLLLVIVFAGFIFNRFRITQKQKKIIEKQKAEVEIQRNFAEEQRAVAEHHRHVVEEKNQEILDSITYARRLQEAILPPRKLVKEYLPNSFILYMPKDIVAGDFYWMETKDDTIYFAAADCTGHGVPGAMVSFVCSNGLTKALIEEGITEPAKILDRTRELVISRFGKAEEEVKDGMDISLVALRPTQRAENDNENEENNPHRSRSVFRSVSWAGANNPLWIIRRSKPGDSGAMSGDEGFEYHLIEVKADKQPIGRYAGEKPFTNHEIELSEGDTIYIFSDGYPDQFGGELGKKYKSAKFKEFLLSIQELDMEQQREALRIEFETWRGSLEQIDDVCIIGVRV